MKEIEASYILPLPTSTEEVISTSSDDGEIYTIESSETIVNDERSDAGNIVTTEIVTTEIVTTDRTVTETIATVEPVQSMELSTEAKEPNAPMQAEKSEMNQLCFELTADEANHKTQSTLGDAIIGRHTDHSEILKGQDSEPLRARYFMNHQLVIRTSCTTLTARDAHTVTNVLYETNIFSVMF